MPFISENTRTLEMDYNFRFRYETLRSLLNKNCSALQIMSDLEADLNHIHYYDERIKRSIRRLLTDILMMAQELNLLAKNRHSDLYETIFKLRKHTDRLFKKKQPVADQPLAVLLGRLGKNPDPELIGGKAFGLHMLNELFKGRVPPGFVITTVAYNRLLEKNNLGDRIRILLTNLDVTADRDQFKSRTQTIRRWIRDAIVPMEIETAIREHADSISKKYPDTLWAIRSSSVFEDGIHSFAGQFDTELNIRPENFVTAYKHVLAGKFTDRAVNYRIHKNIREIDTPMAVLFMPMVDPVAAGVIYTSQLNGLASDTMVINSVPGLAAKMVQGEEPADIFHVSKEDCPKLLKTRMASRTKAGQKTVDYIEPEKLLEIAGLAIQMEKKFGFNMDIEWAVDKNETVHFLQARRLNTGLSEDETDDILKRAKDAPPTLEGGITIFPGRAEGPVIFLRSDSDISKVPDGAVVLAEQPKTEYASLLSKIAALLVMEGNPVGHLATIVREFSVPCIFGLGKNLEILAGKNIISVNATQRTVYTGIRWPGIRKSVLARIASKNCHEKSGPLYDLVLKLNLTDPDAPSFKAKSCKSIHDTVRFIHEMSVRSMFGFGDDQKRRSNKKSRKLKTGLPIKFQLIDLDQSIAKGPNTVEPQDVASLPFKALWRGISDKNMAWPDRWKNELAGMPADFREAVLGGNRGPRRASDRNYAIVAADYINLNARLAYHYLMVDAMVGQGTENNYVHFRFRGGGGGDENRARRARFLESVLRQIGFGVDRRGDLVTAWLRRYSRKDSENSLEIIGRLMVCARQLDAVLKNDADVKRYANYFLKEKYEIFS